MLRIVELCAGTGSVSYICKNRNDIGEVVFISDNVKESREIIEENFPNTLFSPKDLNKLDKTEIPDHDLLVAGFPCQPFSIAGERKGFKDTRSNIFWAICDTIREKLPRFVLLENVKGLRNHDKGRTFSIIGEEIHKLGYKFKADILNTKIVTRIPQNRERLFIVCFRDEDDFDNFDFDLPKIGYASLNDYLLPTNDVPAKYYYDDRFKVWSLMANHSYKINKVYQLRRKYIRESKEYVCPTLTKNMGSGGHNVPLIWSEEKNKVRKLTPRECFSLQGFNRDYLFPEKMSDSKLYRLAGNAFTVPVISHLLEKIARL